MAPRHTPPQRAPKTEDLELDDSDRDSGVGVDAGEDDDSCTGWTSLEKERLTNRDGNTVEDMFTVFVAFRGNMEDEDFTEKLDSILSGIPNMLDMG